MSCGSDSKPDDDGDGENVFISGIDTPRTTTHVYDSIKTYGDRLHAQDGRHNTDWLDEPPPVGYGTPRPTGFFCDEYPFATTVEGGRGASAKLVPDWEQYRIQGPQLRWFYTKCKIAKSPKGGRAIPGSEFRVVADFSESTGYYCKNGVYK